MLKSAISPGPRFLPPAYVAPSKPDWAEFPVSVPTTLAPGISVHHYSQAVLVECVNEMLAARQLTE